MIPKVVHQLWIGGPLPTHLQPFVDSWPQLNPDWEHLLWDDEKAEDFITLTRDAWDRMGEYIAEDQVNQARSDLFRIEVLFRLGGIYADADFQALRPIDDVVEGVECFTAWEVDTTWANMAISGSVPSHPFLERLLEDLPLHMEANRFAGPSSTWLTGPRFITPRLGSDVVVYPSRSFYPYGWDQIGRKVDYGDAYAVHHWNNQRTRRGKW